ncbi:NAD(P)(+) transhydrogenase (Re/Si-specific) subunit beta [Cupriavidus basilensis]
MIALLLGAHLVAAIGGADMPVVVSMAEQLSQAAAATGFMLGK